MATGLAIGVTVVGVAAILALLGLLARQYGLWAWAVNWLRATKEEKTKLCHQERTTLGRSYMDTNGFEDHHRRDNRFFYKLDNDLDWINLWPRSGSYKRFSNLDDVHAEDPHLRMGHNMIPHDPSIPPQPLRPAPGPPHRNMGRETDGMGSPFSFHNAGMMMGMVMRNHGMISRHSNDFVGSSIPMIDRRDSSRSVVSSRIRTSSGQDYSPEILPSTNPFRTSTGGVDHSAYSHLYPNPFATSYAYQSRSHHQPYHSIEEENRLNLIHEPRARPRHSSYSSGLASRNEQHHIYSPKTYEDYNRISPLHIQNLEIARDRDKIIEEKPQKYGYNTDIGPSSSQIAYNHSLNQALMKQRALQQRYISRLDKIKQDEQRIREEERVLNQLRYENNLIRRESFEKSLQNLQSKSPFGMGSLNSNLYDINESRELEREALRENLAYDYQRGASDLREELQKRMLYEIRPFSSQESRDSPPPPAPDITPNLSYSDSGDSSPKEKYIEWRDRINRRNQESREPLDIPTTPPNTAALTPPNSASLLNNERRRSSLVDPYANTLLQERLAEIEKLERHKESKSEMNMRMLAGENETLYRDNKYSQFRERVSEEKEDLMYHEVFTDERNDIGNELNQKPNELHELHDRQGPDIYPRALKERIERRREREGSRRKRKRERDLERRNSFRQKLENSNIKKEPTDVSALPSIHLQNQNVENITRSENIPVSAVNNLINENVNLNNRMESALQSVPINIEDDAKEDEEICKSLNVEQENIEKPEEEESANLLTVVNLSNRNLGDSPVVPRKSFLSYKGSWTLGTNGSDENEVVEPDEEDPNTKRVREYIASLSARLQQLPDKNEGQKIETEVSETFTPSNKIYSTSQMGSEGHEMQCTENILPNQTIHNSDIIITSPQNIINQDIMSQSNVSFPVTPPSSGNRTNSQSSTDTGSSTAANWGSVHGWRGSTETPPNSAGIPGVSPRLSYSDTPPSSASYYAPTPPNSIASETPPPSAEYSATPPNSGSLNGSFDLGTIERPMLKRAMSCDSVSSDTSVTLGELEDESGQITGYLSVQVVYESDTQDLEVVVLEARDLIGPDPNVPVDSYVRVFLLPDKSTNMQTRVAKKSNNPSYRERFLFALEEDETIDRSLSFYMYATDKFTNTMIGEAQIKLSDLNLSSTETIELSLTDSGQKGVGYGEIMFSLSYLPTAERLTVVIVKARTLKYDESKGSGDPFVKVYILQNGKKIMKKRTTVKRGADNPVFNEAMIFNVPAPSLHNIQLRLTVAEYAGEHSLPLPVGHVIVGTQATGKALSHWNQMMSSLRKPIAMWHALRRKTKD